MCKSQILTASMKLQRLHVNHQPRTKPFSHYTGHPFPDHGCTRFFFWRRVPQLMSAALLPGPHVGHSSRSPSP